MAVIVVSTWIKRGKLLIIEYMLSTILSIILHGTAMQLIYIYYAIFANVWIFDPML